MRMPGLLLLVEDNRLIAFSLQRELQSLNYQVTTAHSAAEAMHSAKLTKPDVIIMDINLGEGSDGIDVMHQIHDTIGFIPNIYLTGYVVEELAGRANATSPAAILEKPVDLPPLTRILCELVPGE